MIAPTRAPRNFEDTDSASARVDDVHQALRVQQFDPVLARKWASLDFGVSVEDHIDIALAWDAWDFSPGEAHEWAQVVGVSEFKEAALWTAAGFLPEWAGDVLRFAGDPPDWRRCDIDPEWCAMYTAAGMSLREATMAESAFVDQRSELWEKLVFLRAMLGEM